MTSESQLTCDSESVRSRVEVLWRTLVTDTYNNEHPAPYSCGIIFFEYLTRALAWIYRLEELEQPPISHIPRQQGRWQRMIGPWQSLLKLEPKGSPFSYEIFERHFSASIQETASQRRNLHYREQCSDFERDLRFSGHMRRLFRTAMVYLGIGAFSLQAGDEVWILGGADTPMILRKLPSGLYALVGEAYIHGIMHGEAVQSLIRESLRSITLK